MLNKNNKYKKVLCLYWKKGICRKEKEYCSFAHGESDIIKEECLNSINCYDEDCKFNHPKEWNAFENKKDCDFCIKDFCNKENKKFKHKNIKDTIKNKKDENKEIVFNENDFPELNKKIKNDDNKNMLYINEDINELDLLKKELYKNYKLLSSTTDWCDDLEIDNNIKELNDKYNYLKKKINKEDIFENDLNLNIFHNDHDTNDDKIDMDEMPNIEIKINGIDINKYNENEKNICNNYIQINNNEDKILNLLNEMENFNKKMIFEIKSLLNEKYKHDDNIVKYKYQLNELTSKIYLLKLNYKDDIYLK